MGFKARVVGKVAEALVNEGLLGGAVSLIDNTRSVEALIERNPTGYKMITKAEHRGLLPSIGVYDEKSRKKKYTIKIGGPKTIRLFDLEKNEIGKVVRDKDFFFKDVNYDMFLHGKDIGNAHKVAATKLRIAINGPYDWYIESSLWGLATGDYKVIDGKDQLVMKIRCSSSDGNQSVIEYEDKKHEEMALIMLMVLILVMSENG